MMNDDEKIIKNGFKIFMEEIEFELELFLFYTTPLYVLMFTVRS